MGKVLVIEEEKKIGYEEYEERLLQPDEVRIRTLYSGISAGTQLTLYRGRNPFNTKVFDREKRIFGKELSDHLLYPNRGAWGYEEVGEACEVGEAVTGIRLGDVIYGVWGHRSSHIAKESYCREHLLPKGLDPITGIYSQMGVIALNAILDADIHVGEYVAVFGQGVPGQLVAQLARLNGAHVIAVDRSDYRLEMSKRLGAEYVLNTDHCDAGRRIKEITGHGADVCIEISGSSAALQEAIRSVVYNGRVICSGFIAQEAKDLYLGEEFHHNRVQLICSQVDGVNVAVSNRWNRLRMEKTIMELALSKKLDVETIITNIFPFEKAAEAYGLLDTSVECLQTVLKF